MERFASASESRPARPGWPAWIALSIVFTVLLSVLVAERIDERKRLPEKFAGEARVLAARLADDFDVHLDQLAEDVRLLGDVLWQSENDPNYPSAVRSRVLRDGVHALTSAVEYCRGVGFSRDGKTFATALDPDEDPALAPWLEEHARVAFHGPRDGYRLQGPMPAPLGRPFFVLVQNLPAGVAVAAIDVRRFFELLQHRRPADARAVIVDAEQTLWVACGSVATCRGIARADWQGDAEMRAFVAERRDGEGVPRSLRQALGIAARAPLAVHWHTLATGAAPFTLASLTSLSELQTLKQAGWWRLLATVAAMVLSAGVVTVFLWRARQQERILRERLLHAEAVNRLEHQLVRAEKLATVGVLTAGLAHELGTPLAVIRGRAEMLEERTHWPEVETILVQADRIASTLRQVLDFSREQPVVVRPTDVVTAFRTVSDLLDFRLRAKGVSCRLQPEEGTVMVAADPDQLQQVLVNLVLNACDACPSGGSITLRAQPDVEAAGMVRIEVSDDGCGIPTSQLDAVFDPFFTTKPKGEGTGLGLPVVASIVRNHQAQIGIRSSGKGTTVTLLWPEKGSP